MCIEKKSQNMSAQLIDTRTKSFICNICNKGFFQKCCLDAHYHIHIGEKPFTCDLCNKSFSQKSVLNGHILSHTSKQLSGVKYAIKDFLINLI